MRLADRMATLPPYVFFAMARELHARRRAGQDIVDLGISDPDLPPSPAAIERVCAEARRPQAHRYPPYAGTRALRAAVACWYQRRFGVTFDPDTEVLITNGSKEALVHLALAVVNPGDVVLAPDPGYPAYAMAGALFGAETHYLPLRPETEFLPDLEAVSPDVAGRARLLYVNYPNNPTGRVAPLAAFQRWAAWCRRYDIVLVSDLAYVDIVYEGTAHSVFEVAEARPLAVESLTWSKGHSMQGWRVGALVGPPDLIQAIARIEGNINAGVFLPIQAAAEVAIEEDRPAAVTAHYRRRRDWVTAALKAMGYRLAEPEAAVYCWVEAPGGDGDRFCRAALDAGVAVTPGSAFGPGSRDHFRISLTHGDRALEAGLERLQRLAVSV